MSGVRPWERGRGQWDHRQAVHRESPRGAVAEEPNKGDVVPQCEGPGAGRGGDVRREGGGWCCDLGGGLAEEGRRQRVRRAEGWEELPEEPFPAGSVHQRGAAAGGGGVVHSQHAEPQLRRGAGLRSGGEVAGEKDGGGGCADFEGGSGRL